MENRNARVLITCGSCGKLNRIAVGRAGDRPKCGACGTSIAMNRPLAVSDAHFDRVVAESDLPVLVDFYADWCGPCKAMAPVLDQVAEQWAGRAMVLKLDTDRNPRAATRFQIRGVPTLILFRQGKETSRQVGGVPRAVIEQMLSTV